MVHPVNSIRVRSTGGSSVFLPVPKYPIRFPRHNFCKLTAGASLNCPRARTPQVIEETSMPVTQAARRSYRWCNPPTCGIATTRPFSGGWTDRGSGESFSRERWVLDR
jgi:hypothetical protein